MPDSTYASPKVDPLAGAEQTNCPHASNERKQVTAVTDLPTIDSPRDALDLAHQLGQYRNLVVAFSGGIDSSVVAAAAVRADVDRVLAITARSASVPAWQLDWAQRIAAEIGIEHRIIDTSETERPEYIRNDGQRCFYCKQSLYAGMMDAVAEIAVTFGHATIVSGTNADDLGDYRPGIRAGQIAKVVTPLADLGITKVRVRGLARLYGLSNHDLPASPCLASRIAYGVEVTRERLQRVERAEAWLRGRGFADLRVRLHPGELARIELPVDDFSKVAAASLAAEIVRAFREIGFQFVTFDLGGLQSGSLNRELIPIDVSPHPSRR